MPIQTTTAEWGVMLNDGQVVEFPHPNPEVARRAARSMVQAITNGAYPGQQGAVVVFRTVVIQKMGWVVT